MELEKIKNTPYNKCHEHESKTVEINQVIKNYEKIKSGLEEVLSR